MSEMEKMHTGELYLCNDEKIVEKQTKCLELLYDFNATRPSQLKEREELLKKMFAEIGAGCYIEPPFHADWGGAHCHFGKNVYANFNLTAVDDTHIYVGDYTMFGPNVTIATAGHPIEPELRKKQYQYNMQKLLDWRRHCNCSGSYDRRQCGGRRRQCCNKGFAVRRCSLR